MTNGLSDQVARVLAAPPAGRALAYRGHWRSWSWLAGASAAVDHALDAAGAGGGDAIGLVARNRPLAIAAYAANLAKGRATSMIYPDQRGTALAADIARLGLIAIVAAAEDWSDEALGAARVAGTAAIAMRDAEDGVDIAVAVAADPAAGHRRIAPGVALELLSSGTTGPPKRIPLGWDAIGGAVADAAGAYAGSATAAPQIMVHPLGSVAGLAYATPPLAFARPLVLLDRFDPLAWAEAVRDHRPVRGTVPPAGIRMLLDVDIPRAWLSSLDLIAIGGAAIDPAVREAFEARFGIPLLPAYGATEFGGVVANWTLHEHARHGSAKRGSVGRASRGAVLRIVDPLSGNVVAPGETGLLEAQVRRIGPGWIRTSDLAAIDADGFVFLHGRADDAINRGGFKIVPETVAAALRDHPDVADAAVVGMADARLGEVPVAAVVPRRGRVGDAAALTEWLRDRLLAHQIPVRMAIVEALPRNASMKVSIADVRALFGAGSPE